MNTADLVTRILEAEGTGFLACYPRNALIGACANIGIRPVICRQERVGVGMADGYSRATFGNEIGVFAAQSGPGIENAFPGVAQAYADNVPILVLPSGSASHRIGRRPAFDAVRTFEPVTKWAARAHHPGEIPELLRRAFRTLRSGRGGPVLIEVPAPMWQDECSEPFDYRPTEAEPHGPAEADMGAATELLLAAHRPVIWAGQGILQAGASDALVHVAELLDAPVLTTNPGKSAFPESHPLSLGAAAVNQPPAMTRALAEADLVFAVGSSLTWTPFNPDLPRRTPIIHLTNGDDDIDKEVAATLGIVADARLALEALAVRIESQLEDPRPPARSEATLTEKREFLASWEAQFSAAEVPLNPYRVIAELADRTDRANTIITHDSGSPREHLLPFWEAPVPGSYIGWGKSTQLGHSLGMIMGAKLAHPDKTCIAVMGDAAFCMTGLDIDTAVKNRIAVLVVVLNNGVMACERDSLRLAAEKFDAFEIGGRYADIAAALGCWSSRVASPNEICGAIDNALATLESGRPALLEFVTKECYEFAGM